MKFLPILALVAAAVSSSALAQSMPASTWDAPVMPSPGSAIPAGSAKVDQGLARIIPPPYRIELDRSVPSTMILNWPAGSNWMEVLRQAIAPMGLVAVPDWSHNIVRIMRVHPEVAATMPAPTPTPTHIPAATAPLGGELAQRPATLAAPVAPTGKPLIIPVKAAPKTFTIAAGRRLSDGLAEYARENGWELKWQIRQDYVLDAPLPIPSGSFKDGLTYVLRSYQSQGGLHNVTSSLAEPNHVAVVRYASASETN